MGADMGGSVPPPMAPPPVSAPSQAGRGQTQAGGSAAVTVEEQPARITVEKQQPHVVVEQPTPTVSVEQPKPEVSVQQTQPRVNVRKAEPEVSVQEQGHPRVEVRKTGTPAVTEQQTGQREQQGQQQAEQTMQRQPVQSETGATSGANPLYDKTAGELQGKKIVDVSGKDLGKVDKVVLDRATGQPHVVLAVGGFLGLGDETITLPLSDMTLRDDKLVIPGRRDEDQLKQRPRYQPADYVELQENMTIARQMNASGNGHVSAAFEQLDRNHDGYLSPAEFSAFERGGSE